MSESPQCDPRNIQEAAGRIRENFRKCLRVAVLGPSRSPSTGANGHKRTQIFYLLKGTGHDPFYPETRISLDGSWAVSESELLSSSEVDLIIILQTPGSTGVIAELGAFSLVPAIRRKTAVLTPKEYYTPDQGFWANTVSLYPIHIPYTEQQFEECSLLNDCQQIVDDFLVSDSVLGQIPDF